MSGGSLRGEGRTRRGGLRRGVHTSRGIRKGGGRMRQSGSRRGASHKVEGDV